MSATVYEKLYLTQCAAFDRLELEHYGLKDSFETLKSQNEEFKKVNSGLNERCRFLKKENADLKVSFEALQSEYKELEKTKIILTINNGTQQLKYEALEKENLELLRQGQLFGVSTRNFKLQEENEQKDRQIQAQTTLGIELTEENTNLKEINARLSQGLEEMKKKLDTSAQIHEFIRGEDQKWRKWFSEACEENKQLKKEIKGLRNLGVNQENAALKEELAQANRKLDITRRGNTRLKEISHEKIHGLSAKLLAAEHENSQLKEKLETASNYNDYVKSEYKNLQAHCKCIQDSQKEMAKFIACFIK